MIQTPANGPAPPAATDGSEHRKTTEKDGTGKEAEEKKGIADRLPPWLIKAAKTPRTWKNFFRCMVAVLVTMVFMLVQKSEFPDFRQTKYRQQSELVTITDTPQP